MDERCYDVTVAALFSYLYCKFIISVEFSAFYTLSPLSRIFKN
jgi:hypothetical protein